jgi:hypothetical protein
MVCISIPLSCNSDVSSDSHSLQPMSTPNDGDNGALLPQDPNVQMDDLIGIVILTPPASALSEVISQDPSSHKEGSAMCVNGKSTLTCSICRRPFERRCRAEACENMHQNKRPYACNNACGTNNWYVFVYTHSVVVRTLSSSASFPSKAGLSRHSRAAGARNKACRQWYVELLG